MRSSNPALHHCWPAQCNSCCFAACWIYMRPWTRRIWDPHPQPCRPIWNGCQSRHRKLCVTGITLTNFPTLPAKKRNKRLLRSCSTTRPKWDFVTPIAPRVSKDPGPISRHHHCAEFTSDVPCVTIFSP